MSRNHGWTFHDHWPLSNCSFFFISQLVWFLFHEHIVWQNEVNGKYTHLATVKNKQCLHYLDIMETWIIKIRMCGWRWMSLMMKLSEEPKKSSGRRKTPPPRAVSSVFVERAVPVLPNANAFCTDCNNQFAVRHHGPARRLTFKNQCFKLCSRSYDF